MQEVGTHKRSDPVAVVFLGLTPGLQEIRRVERLVPGAVHRVREVVRTGGGKAVNAARAAHTLAAQVRLREELL